MGEKRRRKGEGERKKKVSLKSVLMGPVGQCQRPPALANDGPGSDGHSMVIVVVPSTHSVVFIFH